MLTKIKNNKIIIIVATLVVVAAVISGIIIFKKDTDASVTTTPIKNVAEESVDDKSTNETAISTEDITTDDEDNLVIDTDSDNVKIEDDVAVIKDDDGNEVVVAVKTEDGKTVVDTSKKVVKNKDGEYETKSSDTPSVTVDTKGQVVVKNTDDEPTTTTKQTTTTAKPTTTTKQTTATKQTTKTTTTTKATTTKKVEEKVEAPERELGPTVKEPAAVATTTTKATTTAKVTEAPKKTTTKTTTTKATTTTTAKPAEEEKEVHVCDWRTAIPVYKDVVVPAWDETVKKREYSNKCHGCGLQEYYVEEAWNNKDEATLKKLILTNVTDKKVIKNVNEINLLEYCYNSHDLFTTHCDICGDRGYGWTSSSVEVEQVIHHEETTKQEVDHYICSVCGKTL